MGEYRLSDLILFIACIVIVVVSLLVSIQRGLDPSTTISVWDQQGCAYRVDTASPFFRFRYQRDIQRNPTADQAGCKNPAVE